MPSLMSTPYQIYDEFINNKDLQTEIFQTALHTLNTPEGKRNLDLLIGQRLDFFNGEGSDKIRPLVNTILNMGMQKLRPLVDRADTELLRQQTTVSLQQHPGERYEQVSSGSGSDSDDYEVPVSTVSGVGGEALLPRRGGGRKTKRRRRKTKRRVRKSKKVKKRKSKKSR